MRSYFIARKGTWTPVSGTGYFSEFLEAVESYAGDYDREDYVVVEVRETSIPFEQQTKTVVLGYH